MIGWYAHHHGQGHLSRAVAVARHLPEVTVFSSRPGPDVESLPLDVDAPASAWAAAQPCPSHLHYAPLKVEGLRRRMGTIARWVDEHDPDAFVVDVSTEVAMFVRLMGVPTVVVRQHGQRWDTPHAMAYEGAALLLAPYPEWLEDEWVCEDLRSRTCYTGGFSRFDGRTPDREASREHLGWDPEEPVVVVMPGAGGRTGWPVEEAAAALPDHRFVVLGDLVGHDRVQDVGWVEDPWAWLCAADLVVTHAGHNAVMEAAAARRPLLVIPQDRPFDEQGHKARALREHGVCLVAEEWPAAAEWPRLVAQAAEMDLQPLAALVDGRGAARAATALARLAAKAAGRRTIALPDSLTLSGTVNGCNPTSTTDAASEPEVQPVGGGA